VNQAPVDLQKLREALRKMSRGHLLMIAERALDHLPNETLVALIGGFVPVPLLDDGQTGDVPLLDQMREFCEASLRGDYHDSFDVNSKNCTQLSKGTEAFIAEFDRLITLTRGAATAGSLAMARAAFEQLFALLRRIDEDPDSVIFFADEAGSWQIPVDWRAVLPTYFQCLADDTSGEEFAHVVDAAISDFCHHERPYHVAAAERVANAAQKAALQSLPTRNGRR